MYRRNLRSPYLKCHEIHTNLAKAPVWHEEIKFSMDTAQSLGPQTACGLIWGHALDSSYGDHYSTLMATFWDRLSSKYDDETRFIMLKNININDGIWEIEVVSQGRTDSRLHMLKALYSRRGPFPAWREAWIPGRLQLPRREAWRPGGSKPKKHSRFTKPMAYAHSKYTQGDMEHVPQNV